MQRSDTRACLPMPSIIWYRYSVRRRKLQSAAPLACRHEITNPDRKSPHPHAGGMPDCIGDRDSAVGDADFTDLLDAERVYMRVVFLDRQDVHGRNIGSGGEQTYAKIIVHAARTVITSNTSDAAAKSANLIITSLMSAWIRLWAIRRAT